MSPLKSGTLKLYIYILAEKRQKANKLFYIKEDTLIFQLYLKTPGTRPSNKFLFTGSHPAKHLLLLLWPISVRAPAQLEGVSFNRSA